MFDFIDTITKETYNDNGFFDPAETASFEELSCSGEKKSSLDDESKEVWWDNDFSPRENRIYSCLLRMENGDLQERRQAFHLTGLLANDSISMSLEEKLDYVEERIKRFYACRLKSNHLPDEE